jgi:3-hydroxybutyrate dehydrogenase
MAGSSTIVTGAGRGLGRAMALGLLEAGHNVIAIDRDPQELTALEHDAKPAGSTLACLAVDLALSDSAKTIMAFAEQKFGPVACLVNCAGIGQEIISATFATEPVKFWTVGEDIWRRIFAVNADAVFRLCAAVTPDMIARGWGRIINIGSTAASVGWKDNPAYCASKSGLLGLTRCVALEGAPHGVTCVMISPTWVETELMRRNVAQLVARDGSGRTLEDAMADIARQNPQQRIVQPGEIAALAVFLCGDDAKGITAENIQVTGGALW